MNGQELSDYIKSVPAINQFFVGVFAINTIPRSLSKRHFFFVNTDISTGNGIHWQCILKNDDNKLEYFDSLGFTEKKLENFAKFCKIKSKSLIYNETKVQLDTSDTCGLFCLYFILNRLFNIDFSFRELLNDIFCDDAEKNELKVKKFLNL